MLLRNSARETRKGDKPTCAIEFTVGNCHPDATAARGQQLRPFQYIAAAYHACIGEDLRKLTFIEGQMRTHLSKCFWREKLAAFPKTKIQVRRPELQFLSIAICCKCKRPDSYKEMVQCDKCDSWYHFSCANVHRALLGSWFCLLCTCT